MGRAAEPVTAAGTLRRYILGFDGQYQKQVETITGRVLLSVSIAPADRVKERSAPPAPLMQSRSPGAGSLSTKLVVKLLRAEGLLAKDRGGTSDPFAELRVGQQLQTSKVVDKTLSPEWNETFEFEVGGGGEPELSVVLWDHDKGLLFGSSKEYLGSVKVPLRQLLERGGGTVENW